MNGTSLLKMILFLIVIPTNKIKFLFLVFHCCLINLNEILIHFSNVVASLAAYMNKIES